MDINLKSQLGETNSHSWIARERYINLLCKTLPHHRPLAQLAIVVRTSKVAGR